MTLLAMEGLLYALTAPPDHAYCRVRTGRPNMLGVLVTNVPPATDG